uniref:Uncharacterized protein n=1 Tax=Mycena chlorophos TaxID=658473 RepID=A0ABQ0L4L7_MYCCL|nr:predicted protein [Mycena chlorophos]
MSRWTRLAVAALSVLNVAASFNSSECRVKVWVRAEDLTPGSTSNGDIRVKVSPAECGTQVASVSLRLQLDEFAEVKYLRPSTVLPEITKVQDDDATRPASVDAWESTRVTYNYTAYDAALSDPAYWVVKAEERRGWVTETTLIDNSSAAVDFSQPQVIPFVVVSPLVNYPPAREEYPRPWAPAFDPGQSTRTALGYHYHAVAVFQDGRTEEVFVGHTNFRPVFTLPAPTSVPFIWDDTFEDPPPMDGGLPSRFVDRTEDCLPRDLRSSFTAHVELENGNVLHTGQTLRGRVTVDATSGSTNISTISVTLRATMNDHWARRQADTVDDTKVPQFDGLGHVVVSTDSYQWIVNDETMCRTSINHRSRPSVRGAVSQRRPTFDFALDIHDSFFPEFESHYWSSSAILEIQLNAAYSREAAQCMASPAAWDHVKLDEDIPDDDEDLAWEDDLWDSNIAVGKRRERTIWTMPLFMQVPVVVLGAISSEAVPHYLTPNVASPVILPASSPIPSPLPPAQPLVIEEPVQDSIARMLLAGWSADPEIEWTHEAWFVSAAGKRWTLKSRLNDLSRCNRVGCERVEEGDPSRWSRRFATNLYLDFYRIFWGQFMNQTGIKRTRVGLLRRKSPPVLRSSTRRRDGR